jgi:hypothetical protein
MIMATKTYLARTDTEARALHAGTQAEIVIAMDPQPPWFMLSSNVDGDRYGIMADGMANGHVIYTDEPGVVRLVRHGLSVPGAEISCPYQPGDEIAVKEAWTWTSYGLDCLYKADPYDGPFQIKHQWKPAETMPEYAIRTRLVCTSVKVREIAGTWSFVVGVSR